MLVKPLKNRSVDPLGGPSEGRLKGGPIKKGAKPTSQTFSINIVL